MTWPIFCGIFRLDRRNEMRLAIIYRTSLIQLTSSLKIKVTSQIIECESTGYPI